MEAIFTKTVSDGRVVEVRLEQDGDRDFVAICLEGKQIGADCNKGVYPLQQPKGDSTHYLASRPAIGVTAAEANSITAAVEAARERIASEKESRLEANVEGLSILRAAQDAYRDDIERHAMEFEAMMDDEYNDGAFPPAPKDPSLEAAYKTLSEQYPRAALYLKAKQQSESTSWADNTGAGAAGRKAMDMLANGGTEADAEQAMAERRTWVD